MLSVLFEHVNKSQCLRTPQWDFALSHTGVCMGVYMSCYVYIKTDPIYFINTCFGDIAHDSSRHIFQNISSEFNNLLCLDFYFHIIHLV